MNHKNWLSPFRDDFLDDNRYMGIMPRYFEDFFSLANRQFGPSIDLHETDNEVVLHADIPGVKREDLDITVDEHSVILKGETKHEGERESKGYHLSERKYGSFYRTIPLPAEVVSEQAIAKYKDGVLELRIPKVETSAKKGFKPRIETDYEKH
ncbi:MAG: Hsp20/alpha crystallin family protein [Bacillota bacterium]